MKKINLFFKFHDQPHILLLGLPPITHINPFVNCWSVLGDTIIGSPMFRISENSQLRDPATRVSEVCRPKSLLILVVLIEYYNVYMAIFYLASKKRLYVCIGSNGSPYQKTCYKEFFEKKFPEKVVERSQTF